MRPQSIVNFERIYILSIILSIVAAFVGWDTMMANPAVQRFGPNFVWITEAVSLIIMLLLLYFIARRASVVAKWIFVILFLLGLIGFLMQLGTLFQTGILGIIQIVQIVLQAIAVYLLFRPDARAWFADGRGGEETVES